MIGGLTLIFAAAAASAPVDPRYCGTPSRTAVGRIERSAQVIRDFKSIHACPATRKNSGACPGWAIDHVIPLACGGCDSIGNMQWLPVQTKSASGAFAKDRFERRIYCATGK